MIDSDQLRKNRYYQKDFLSSLVNKTEIKFSIVKKKFEDHGIELSSKKYFFSTLKIPTEKNFLSHLLCKLVF